MPASRNSSGPAGREEIYRLAVKLEEESYRFYEELLAAVPDRGVQNEVRFLRDEELKHKEFFKGLLEGLRGRPAGGAVAAAAPAEMDLLQAEKDFLQPMREKRDAKALASRAEALRLGSLFERGAVQFYERIRKGESDPEVLRGLDEVLEEERRHLKKLNIILAY